MIPVELTSGRSPRVTAARRLQKRAHRHAERRFLAEGPQAVREALSGGEVFEVFLTAEAQARHPDLVAEAAARNIAVVRVSGEILGSLSGTVTPQGIVAICGFVDARLTAVAAAQPKLVALLAAARDPGNAGTVIRTADAAGADAVVLTDTSVDIYNGKCVRASAGSLWHLPVVASAPAVDAMEALRTAGLRILAADGQGTADLDHLSDSGDLALPTAWIFGNEAWGLPPDVLALADEVVRVPIYGRAESLNLATAAAVCLYASARAQRTHSSTN